MIIRNIGFQSEWFLSVQKQKRGKKKKKKTDVSSQMESSLLASWLLRHTFDIGETDGGCFFRFLERLSPAAYLVLSIEVRISKSEEFVKLPLLFDNSTVISDITLLISS